MAKVETQKIYRAADGTPFNTEALAEAHDQSLRVALVVGMTEANLADAMSGADPTRAKAIEHIGRTIFEMRKQRGEVKSRKKAPAADPAPSAAPSHPRAPRRPRSR